MTGCAGSSQHQAASTSARLLLLDWICNSRKSFAPVFTDLRTIGSIVTHSPHFVTQARRHSNQSVKPKAPLRHKFSVCHDTLPWLISFSFSRCMFALCPEGNQKQQ